MRGDGILFWEYDWHAVTQNQLKQLQKTAGSLSADAFEQNSLDVLAGELAAQFSLEPPKIEPENIEIRQRGIEIDVSGDRSRAFSRSGPHYVKGTAIDVKLPFTGDEQMFGIRPSTYNFDPPKGWVRDGYIEFTVSGTGLTAERVKAEIDSRVKSISEFLEFQSKSIGTFPQELRRVAYQALEQRQAKLKADEDLISGLGYKTRTPDGRR
jgi:hypothetical protein